MTTALLRLAIVGWILLLLVRAARAAWHQRALVVTVWRRIRPRHVVGSFGLLVMVVTVAGLLLTTVPWLGYGLGSLIGFEGNAVFAPLEEAAARAGPAPAAGPDWLFLALTTGFLGFLIVLLPWLAFVEEEVFRAGLERASPTVEVRAALWFGLVHLVMLVPLAAALAIAVAGFVYGRIYRAAYRRAGGGDVPAPVARAFRSTRRSAAAAAAERQAAPGALALADGPLDVAVDRRPERRQAEATLASAVWHTTFNTLVIVLVWVSIVGASLTG